MNINFFLLIGNPFLDAYINSDLLGKLIFIFLLLLSIISWVILIYKVKNIAEARKLSLQFLEAFQMQKLNPLALELDGEKSKKNPFQSLYALLKRQTLELLNKNKKFHSAKGTENSASFLSTTDIDFVQSQLITSISNHAKLLEKHLFILSTIVTLAPFLGLLGTVWGILTTFSSMQGLSSSHDAVLSGLSLALATTVLGLIDAIPALIGYNYLKNSVQDFQTDMESFSNEMLASLELQYRQVDVN